MANDNWSQVNVVEATVEKFNNDVQLQALIDDKKVIVTKAIIRRDLHLDDADGVECLPNAKIFEELARMGYEKPPPNLTFYKAFFSVKWNFMASAVICLATGRKFNFSKYIFDNMVRNVDSPSVETPLFASMLVQSQSQAEEGVEVPIIHVQPSTNSTSSPTDLQDTTPTPHVTPPQCQPPTPHTSPLQDQPTTPHDSPMPLLTKLMETRATLSQKVAELEKDKHSQALEIPQLKKRVKKLERKQKSKISRTHLNKGKIAAIDADESITLVDIETNEEEVAMDAESPERTKLNAASKGFSAISASELVSTAEPTVFDDENVTMTMAQTLIKLKAEKARILDEKIA
nr:hypothetical protein [Tanacetum cinerariifolium]